MNKLPLASMLCPSTIEEYTMIDKLVKLLEDPSTSEEVRKLAKMGLDLALQSHNETNPTFN